ncbi:cell division protein FtsL [Enterococcus sp. 7E2_DIV0204]|uniref:Cell division protein FtsL n=1 Tax=Candidatus Enterococcus lemimoniae TaxID=1834167 RepID=A0ABZ2T991_9ENTE|nr:MULTISPECIES: cell division protein FtsL [unclassified Enterococcus]OTN88061.1 cell division protein FtsL [Enterococcus sp. 7E2_DIV0204]OTO70235.1 cell division protein FtsL [Enterococcus sp. 12C11_DIV0727]OTP49260.1 cell division protein FtsL [Enterococcus sp. 7D2_DIV0200]
MAELKKVEDFQYDIPVIEEPVTEAEQKPKVQRNLDLPQSPKRKLRNISLLEKTIGFLLLVAIIGIAVLTIQVRTSITQMTNEITETQATIQEKEESALKLEQQKNELSKADRIRDVAKSKGLSDNLDSIRNVK